jgi:hypothetical protein
MAFLECDVFFLGTASRNGGMRSRSERNDGIARPKDPARNVGKRRLANDGPAMYICSVRVGGSRAASIL